MRKFKFRIWQESFKKYKTFPEERCAHSPCLYSEGCGFEFLQKENYILEQFTGFYDKNGKEIYEGDILIYRYSYEQAMICGETQTFGKVEWKEEDGCWHLYGGLISDLTQEGGRLAEDEIIGNIHQNSELLKEIS